MRGQALLQQLEREVVVGDGAAVCLARSVASEPVYVAGAVGPYGRLEAGQEAADGEKYVAFQEQIEALLRELIDVALDYAPGFYIMPQFEKYEAAVVLVQHIKQRAKEKGLARPGGRLTTP